MFCRVGQNALAMQTHQPQIVENDGGSARLTPLEPPYVLKNHSLEGCPLSGSFNRATTVHYGRAMVLLRWTLSSCFWYICGRFDGKRDWVPGGIASGGKSLPRTAEPSGVVSESLIVLR